MKKLAMLMLVASTAFMGSANAAEFRVMMLNKGEKGAMVFEPDFIQAAVGDTVVFIPTDKGHNVASIKKMLPEGVKKFKSKTNKEFTLTLEAEGLYGVRCLPHFALGMVAMIVAGKPVNLEQAKKGRMSKKGKKRMKEHWETLAKM